MPSRNFKNVETRTLVTHMIFAMTSLQIRIEQIGFPENHLFPEKQVII